uniref:ascorbate ferrireductase (transmembrane) n=1 Tax=Anas platyrhynchos platyrhynchos TaxID=8840 RepID=A0A493T928_ANAPP
MSLPAEGEPRLLRSLRAAAAAAAHAASLGLPAGVAALARPGSSECGGFSLLLTQALLVFSPEASPLRSLSRKAKVRAHWALQVLALLCALLGLALVAYHKELQGKGHFHTWHGRAGLLAVLYASGQSLGGLLLLYPKLARGWPPGKLRLYHATAGLVGYLLGCASLVLGMCSLWFTAAVSGAAWYLAVLCPLLSSLVVMNQVSNAYLYRKRSQH